MLQSICCMTDDLVMHCNSGLENRVLASPGRALVSPGQTFQALFTPTTPWQCLESQNGC